MHIVIDIETHSIHILKKGPDHIRRLSEDITAGRLHILDVPVRRKSLHSPVHHPVAILRSRLEVSYLHLMQPAHRMDSMPSQIVMTLAGAVIEMGSVLRGGLHPAYCIDIRFPDNREARLGQILNIWACRNASLR